MAANGAYHLKRQPVMTRAVPANGAYMDIKFAALFAHSFDKRNILSVPQFLNRNWPKFKELWPTYEIVNKSDADVLTEVFWVWDESLGGISIHQSVDPDDLPPLVGPCGFGGQVADHVISIVHGTHWLEFLKEDTIRFILSETCKIFATLFQVEHWLYVPHAAFKPAHALQLAKEGATMKEIEDWLQQECGQAAMGSIQGFDDTEIDQNSYFQESAKDHSLYF